MDLRSQREKIKAQIRKICAEQPALSKIESEGVYHVIQASSLAASGCPSWQGMKRMTVTKVNNRNLMINGESRPRGYWKDYLLIPRDRVEEVKELQAQAEQLRQLELAAVRTFQSLTIDKVRRMAPSQVQQFIDLFKGEIA